MIDEKILKSPFRIAKEAKELAIYKEYESLINEEGAMAGSITQHLMKKHKIHARSTIWFIRNRVGKRLKEEAEKKAESKTL